MAMTCMLLVLECVIADY